MSSASYPREENLYYKLNLSLRKSNRALFANQYLPYITILISAISKIPQTSKTLYRGIVGVNFLEQSNNPYIVGNTVVWSQFSSCSLDFSVAESIFKSPDKKHTLFYIDTQYGHPIWNYSMFAKEEEFLLLPGAHFKVTKVIEAEQVSVIYLKQTHQETYKVEMENLRRDSSQSSVGDNSRRDPISTSRLREILSAERIIN